MLQDKTSTVTAAVGHRIPRRDAFEKVTGAARYTTDLKLPGMLHARLLRSPYPHARVVRVDTGRAERLPGVVAILTKDNTTKVRYTDSDTDELNLLPFPPNLDQVLFDERVRYAGEPVAAVAATSAAVAEQALELIEVEYEQLPAVFDAEAALAPDAPRIHDHVQGNLAGYLPLSFGDVEAGFREADLVVEETFRTARQKHCQMEPQAVVASYDRSGKLTLWSGTQTPHLNKQKLAKLFGLPQSQVRVINPHIGGAFGANLGFTVDAYAAALAIKTGRPVRLALTREEVFVGTSSRHPMVVTLKLGFKRDGTLTAIQARTISNTGAYATQGPDVTGAHAVHFFRLYPCPNLKFEGLTVYTNTPPCGAFRGFGGPQAVFALEQVIDMAAERLGLDPLALRRKLSIGTGGFDVAVQRPVASCGLPDCLDQGAAAIGWAEKRGRRLGSGSRRRGVGMASVMWVSGTACMVTPLDASAAVVTLNQDGSATVLSAACELGTGIKTALVQIAADELGIPVERVLISETDTDTTPLDVGAHASRTLYQAGNAVRLAAADARRQLLAFAAEQLEVSPDDLEVVAGVVRVRGAPDKSRTWSELAQAAYLKATQFIGRAVAPPANDPPFGAQFAEVEVDAETGEVVVVRLVSAHDVGRAINPQIVEGQIEGAVQQGLGYALYEDLPIDPETGAVLATTFADYRMPTAAVMPPVEVQLIESAPAAQGPFGAKGVGEVGLVPTAAAIANAVYDAVGVRLTELPITPERVLAALKERAPA